MGTAGIDDFVRDQLESRRHRLRENLAERTSHPAHLHALLREVDSALDRIANGSYGLCEMCHETIETDRLICDPLVRFCLDHLSRQERDALERDLALAANVQKGLLPPSTMERYGWHICYHYDPAGVVSGDYCDVIDAGPGGLHFIVGDVSGKGVAASMLMAHLHATFRALIQAGIELKCLLEHASHVFSESTLPNQYATLVYGRAFPDGSIEISNAGHPPPIVVRNDSVTAMDGANLPLGMFSSEKYSVTKLSLGPGDLLVIYSDGISEATDQVDAEYGVERLSKLMYEHRGKSPADLLAAVRDDLAAFRLNCPKADDATLFVLARTGDRSILRAA
jgi:sigma-B regulation protein RsbU (phosphoserine phosphatase)